MPAAMPWNGSAQAPQMNDPNELLNRIRRIDQTTTQTFHWVRLGIIVLIVIGILIILVG
jgi:hypothetical protein